MRRLVLIPLLALVCVPATASAATVTVGCGNALQDALDNPANSEVILQAGSVCDGTYYLPARDLTLRGAVDDQGHNLAKFENHQGGRSLTTKPEPDACNRSARRCRRATSLTHSVDHLDFLGATPPARGAARAGGQQGGGMYWQGSELTLSHSNFQDIDSGNEPGGGLWVDNAGSPDPTGTVTLTDDTFTDNSTLLSGGGARINADKVTVQGTALGKSVFSGNTADSSGGGLALTIGRASEGARGVPPADAKDLISKTTFDGNVAGTGPCEDEGGGGLLVTDYQFEPYDGQNRGVSAGVAKLAVGDNVYTDNLVGNFRFSECDQANFAGGGAEFIDIDVVAYTTELYSGNTVQGTLGAETEGGGFAVSGFNGGFSPAAYTGQNTVVTNNQVVASNGDDDRGAAARVQAEGEVPNGAGIYVGGQCTAQTVGCGSVLNLTHATITGNTVSSDDPIDGATGVGISGNPGDEIDLDRSIVYFNTVATGGSGGRQVFGAGTIKETNSDVGDCMLAATRATDDQGNICADPVFATPTGRSLAGSPVQDASSPTVDATSAIGSVTDDYLHHARPSPTGGKADIGAHELGQKDPVVTVSPSPSPAPSTAPTVTVTPSPTPDDTGVEAENNGHKKRVCGGRRYFPIVLRRIGFTFVKAKIVVNGRHVKTIRYRRGVKKGRLGARIDLRKFPRRTIRIAITARTTTGRTIKGKRVYHPCYRGRRPHTVPKL